MAHQFDIKMLNEDKHYVHSQCCGDVIKIVGSIGSIIRA
jgi:hypothetical protein